MSPVCENRKEIFSTDDFLSPLNQNQILEWSSFEHNSDSQFKCCVNCESINSWGNVWNIMAFQYLWLFRNTLLHGGLLKAQVGPKPFSFEIPEKRDLIRMCSRSSAISRIEGKYLEICLDSSEENPSNVGQLWAFGHVPIFPYFPNRLDHVSVHSPGGVKVEHRYHLSRSHQRWSTIRFIYDCSRGFFVTGGTFFHSAALVCLSPSTRGLNNETEVDCLRSACK